MAATGEPETEQQVQDRRGADRRRGEDRRVGGRREEDRARRRANAIIAVLWAICGAIVVLYLFFVALGAIDPVDAQVVSIVVLALAIVWVGHAWQRLYRGGYVSRTDRERRGF